MRWVVVVLICWPVWVGARAEKAVETGGIGKEEENESFVEMLPVGDSLNFTVNKAISGDTLELASGKKLHLIGVEAPRMGTANRPADYFAKESAAFVNRLVKGKEVSVTFEKTKVDPQGRWLGYVWLPDGDFLNYRVISEGYGFLDPKAKLRSGYKKGFLEAQAASREDRAGMWRNPGKASALQQEKKEKAPFSPRDVPAYNPSKSFIPKPSNRSGSALGTTVPRRGIVQPTGRRRLPRGYQGTRYGPGVPHLQPGPISPQSDRALRRRARSGYRGYYPYLYNNGTFVGITPISGGLKTSGVKISPPRRHSAEAGSQGR